MKRFAEEALELGLRFDAIINPRGACSQRPLDVRLTPAEVVALDLQEPKRVAEWKKLNAQLGVAKHLPEQRNLLWQCGGGLNSLAVDAYGKLQVCVLSKSETYDLRNGRFQEGWQQFLYNLKQKKITRRTKCTACGLKAVCNMCPASAELECMDAESPVDFMCEVSHLRAYAFGIPVAPHGNCEYCEGGSRYQEIMQIVNALKKD